jgi:DNA-binding MarR family transcriptional regulator
MDADPRDTDPPDASPLVPIRGCTNFKLRQLVRAVSRLYDAEIGKAGLKGTQYSLLAQVAGIGPVQPIELARRLGMDASTLSRNLRPLVDQGWLVQRAGADARSRLIEITEAGQAKRRLARHHWKLAQEALIGRLGAAQVQALHALIDEGLARLPSADEH